MILTIIIIINATITQCISIIVVVVGTVLDASFVLNLRAFISTGPGGSHAGQNTVATLRIGARREHFTAYKRKRNNKV